MLFVPRDSRRCSPAVAGLAREPVQTAMLRFGPICRFRAADNAPAGSSPRSFIVSASRTPMTRAALDRRAFLRTATAGALIGVVPARLLHGSGATRAQPSRTADAALRELLAGNARFVANHLTLARQELKALREQTV